MSSPEFVLNLRPRKGSTTPKFFAEAKGVLKNITQSGGGASKTPQQWVTVTYACKWTQPSTFARDAVDPDGDQPVDMNKPED
eukprot:6212938-Pleurochrysis_carterae.AAC.16